MADGSSRRTRAFVSYSHADAEHLTRLHVHLAPFLRQGKVDVWDASNGQNLGIYTGHAG